MKRTMLLALLFFATACPEDRAPLENAPAIELADDDIPVQTDFEDEAKEAITKDNYEAKLEEIEAEIERDKSP